MSYSSEQSNADQASSTDSSLARRNLPHLSTRDQCDLVALEYIGKNTDPAVGLGVTVVEMMRVMGLSNAATSTRLRRMSDPEYGQIDRALIERRKFVGPQGADLYFLANWVTLADVQKIMAMKGYSYDSYQARRKEKKQSNSSSEYENWAIDDVENELIEVDNNKIDSQLSETEENQKQSNSLQPSATYELKGKDIDDSDYENDDAEGIEVAIVRLITEVAELKQNYIVIKEENVLLKEEIANLNSQLAKIEQKLLAGSSYKRLVAKLDEVFAPNQTQNGKDAH
ncbi:hypothetical protein [Microcoleus sp. FACHB-672]|uniref:hypothetical protein n=1 Tax=Microcoleus sp. FACHB-672 TaxID=2692825 RepID=UPI001684048A|nr:hypothetical protein [Microcoleus sp. FACHB-672]MBD2042228.1 hypothetical protein [Microcoleus sp. FACHB-672]